MLTAIAEKKLLMNANEAGSYLRTKLLEVEADLKYLGNIRGIV